MHGKKCKVRASNQKLHKENPSHHKLAGEALLREAVTLRQSGEELQDALVLLQSGVALKRLLDHPTQLLGLTHNN